MEGQVEKVGASVVNINRGNTVLSRDVILSIEAAVRPYLKEGVDALEVVRQIEAAVLQTGVRKATQFLVKKFQEL